MKAMIESFEAGNTPKARDLHLKLLPLFEALFVESNPIPVSLRMSLLGMPAGPLRLPLVEISDAAAKEVRDALSGLGLI